MPRDRFRRYKGVNWPRRLANSWFCHQLHKLDVGCSLAMIHKRFFATLKVTWDRALDCFRCGLWDSLGLACTLSHSFSAKNAGAGRMQDDVQGVQTPLGVVGQVATNQRCVAPRLPLLTVGFYKEWGLAERSSIAFPWSVSVPFDCATTSSRLATATSSFSYYLLLSSTESLSHPKAL